MATRKEAKTPGVEPDRELPNRSVGLRARTNIANHPIAYRLHATVFPMVLN